jgi:hypothetical protein
VFVKPRHISELKDAARVQGFAPKTGHVPRIIHVDVKISDFLRFVSTTAPASLSSQQISKMNRTLVAKTDEFLYRHTVAAQQIGRLTKRRKLLRTIIDRP